MKICTRCSIEQSDENFYLTRRNGKTPARVAHCMRCAQEACKKRYWKNPAKSLEQSAKWRRDNLEKKRQKDLAYQKVNIATIRIRKREWQFKKYHSDPDFRFRRNLRERIRAALRSTGNKRCARSESLLGCPMGYLKYWIESQMRPGMSWKNYGSVWQLDHKKPCASFDLSDSTQQKQCFHYTNLQPLFSLENRKKWSKYEN